MRVNFVVAGTQKGGTTALYEYLTENMDIEMASQKELHYFNDESNFGNELDHSKYHASFSMDAKKRVRGEATPAYMYYYDAPRRIWSYNPRMKFILILRNPVERAYSNWNMERARGNETLSFGEAIRAEESRRRKSLPYQNLLHAYVDRGFYTEQLRRIWSFFPKEQTLIIKSEALNREPMAVLAKISSFLAIQPFASIQKKTIHATPYIQRISQQEVDLLKRLYFYEIKKLEQLLDWDCSDWLL